MVAIKRRLGLPHIREVNLSHRRGLFFIIIFSAKKMGRTSLKVRGRKGEVKVEDCSEESDEEEETVSGLHRQSVE